MTGWIGISLGDVTGVGPEVTLKALAAEAGVAFERLRPTDGTDWNDVLRQGRGV